MNVKHVAMGTLVTIFIGWIAMQLFTSSRPDDQPTTEAFESAAVDISASPKEPSDLRNDVISPPIKEYDDIPPQIIIDGIRPFVRAFGFPETYCVIEIGEKFCTLELRWKVAAKHRPGRILIYSDTDEIVGSGWSGSVQLALPPGEHSYILSYLTENGQNHMVTSVETVAATASGDILAPDRCETASKENAPCKVDIRLIGFATHVILYDLDNHQTLFELDSEGMFRTVYQLDVPKDGIQIGLFSNRVSKKNLLAQKSTR